MHTLIITLANHCITVDGTHLYIYTCTCYMHTLIIALAINLYTNIHKALSSYKVW